jgi:hypothetical protein
VLLAATPAFSPSMKTETSCVDPGLSWNSGVTTTVAWPTETTDVVAEAVVVDHVAAVEVIPPAADVVVIAAVLVKLTATREPQPPLLLPKDVVVVVAEIVVEELEVAEAPYLTVSTLQELESPKLF